MFHRNFRVFICHRILTGNRKLTIFSTFFHRRTPVKFLNFYLKHINNLPAWLRHYPHVSFPRGSGLTMASSLSSEVVSVESIVLDAQNCQIPWNEVAKPVIQERLSLFAKAKGTRSEFLLASCLPAASALMERELLHHGRRAGIEKTTQIRVVSGETVFILHIESFYTSYRDNRVVKPKC